MIWIKDELSIETSGKGLFEFTSAVSAAIARHNVLDGQVSLFVQHTSASLLITENADPTAKLDLESYFSRLAPEGEAWHRHTLEGADDSPSHMRAALTSVSETIPIDNGKLSLGTWQGIYLFEHRTRPHKRRVLLRLLSV